ncbi:MAG TPA: putative quinol monooxygenase [Acidothermaceae bacterium]
MKAKKTDVIVLATARAKPGKESDLEDALRECAGPTREQAGCVQFFLLRAADDKSTIVGYERWVSEADHQRHLKGAHIQRLMARMADILSGPPEIVAYETIDE